jgi:hypothetical protein
LVLFLCVGCVVEDVPVLAGELPQDWPHLIVIKRRRCSYFVVFLLPHVVVAVPAEPLCLVEHVAAGDESALLTEDRPTPVVRWDLFVSYLFCQ